MSFIPHFSSENAVLLVTQAINTIMTREGLNYKDLIISKLLGQDIQKYKSLFPHVSAAIQSKKYPLKGDTIQYIYTDSKHNNPLCRVVDLIGVLTVISRREEKSGLKN
jgi:DNA polymerase elongation subunit (family B)